jgi:mannose-6-phosphate isomerase-like protein (cupin superfamily)
MDEKQVKNSFKIYKYDSSREWAERDIKRGKQNLHLGSCGGLNVGVQVVIKGGETNLHAHPGFDSSWYVLSGRVKFYGAGDTLVADLAKGEGVFIPRGVPYWFESASDEKLEILHITSGERGHVNFEPIKAHQERQLQQRRDARHATPEEMQAGHVLESH